MLSTQTKGTTQDIHEILVWMDSPFCINGHEKIIVTTG